MNTTVLILNFLKSKIEKPFVDIIRSIDKIDYYTIDNSHLLEENFSVQPAIIFLILKSCCKSTEELEIEKINNLFPLVPKIGILEDNIICSECEILRKYIWNFFIYPFRKEEISLAINWFCKSENNNDTVYNSLKKHTTFELFRGESAKSIAIKEKLLKVAKYDVTVLINGETGTGKELCAKMIHFMSDRSKNPFIPLNCGAVPSELFENELFGHKKGAYTNAETSENGLITEADNGTLFLDEIESLPLPMQVKLLRFLEDKKYKPLGQANYIFSNARVIAASKENLKEKVKKNQFREDLFYRLNILSIDLPPLRERVEDIPDLISFFINRFAKLFNKEIKGVKPSLMMKLLHHNWEGNVRELQNVVQEAVIVTNDSWIGEDDLIINQNCSGSNDNISSFSTAKRELVTEFEKSYLTKLMIIFEGNLTRASKFAEKDRRALGRLLKKNNIDPSRFRNHSKLV